MTVYLTDRVAAYLAENGPATRSELAEALGEKARRIGDILKSPGTRARWGIYESGVIPRNGMPGMPAKLWAIDPNKYEQHLDKRRPMPWIEDRVKNDPTYKPGPAKGSKKTTKPKVATPKEPKVDYNRKPPVYRGPHRTVWQPSSPYYKGANDEYASPAQGA